MRLKLLFFPLTLVIVFVVIFLNIWPNYNSAKKFKENISQNQKTLDLHSQKRGRLSELKKQKDLNKSQVDWVNQYLPEKAEEEKAINKINYVAAGSNNLTLYKVEFEEIIAPVEEENIAGNMVVTGNIQNVANSIGSENAPVVPEKVKNKFYRMAVGVSGDYSSIRQFFDRLDKIDSYALLKSVEISKSESAEGEDPDRLTVEAKIDFAYLPKIKITNDFENKVLDLNSIDFALISEIQKNNISLPALDFQVENKENPFSVQ